MKTAKKIDPAQLPISYVELSHCSEGFLVTIFIDGKHDEVAEQYGTVDKVYAFTTLEEAMTFLRTIFTS